MWAVLVNAMASIGVASIEDEKAAAPCFTLCPRSYNNSCMRDI